MGTVWDTLAPRNLELGPLAEAERAGATSPWRNWRLAHDEDGIAWLALDKAGASANTLAVDVLSELDKVLASLEKNVPKGLVLRSAKPSGFIAGADIGEFRGLTDAAMVEERLSEAHAVVDRLDRLGAPTVAVFGPTEPALWVPWGSRARVARPGRLPPAGWAWSADPRPALDALRELLSARAG